MKQMLDMSNVAVTSTTVPSSASSTSSDNGSTRSDDVSTTPVSSGANALGVGSSAAAGLAGGGRGGEEPAAASRRDDDCRVAEEDPIPEREKGKSDLDIIRDLKAQLKKSQEAQRELKLLLDMYKGAPKEQRDKVQVSQRSSARACCSCRNVTRVLLCMAHDPLLRACLLCLSCALCGQRSHLAQTVRQLRLRSSFSTAPSYSFFIIVITASFCHRA